MKIFADMHIHSRYSMACSKNINIENLEKYARIKGINLLGTGDFTHPKWIEELKSKLTEQDDGILKTESGFNFLLQTEISNIYSQGGKGRRVHSVILAPNFEVSDQITEALGKKGRLDYDGRPIFGFSCIELVEMMQSISKDIEIIPAHAWTPWFSIFGSKSGFDSIKECFQEKTSSIHAIETGLSSDPPMNWRVSGLDGIQLVSFSDSHSYWPHRMGREATIFETELSYKNILNAIRTGDGLKGTVEVDPAYGKYHWDGHRNCNVVLNPKQSLKNNKMCPSCGRMLTIGVEHRVEELADREPGIKPDNAKDFKHLVPLSEIISIMIGKAPFTKGVWEIYNKLIKDFGSEFSVLLEKSEQELSKSIDDKIAKAIISIRNGEVNVKPGYDGVYGVPEIDGAAPIKVKPIPEDKKPEIIKTGDKQKSIFDYK